MDLESSWTLLSGLAALGGQAGAAQASACGRGGTGGKLASWWLSCQSLHSLPTMVQVSIMEEAGQDVPNWLRGEADRFKNHQVDITLDLRLTMLLA